MPNVFIINFVIICVCFAIIVRIFVTNILSNKNCIFVTNIQGNIVAKVYIICVYI